METTARAQVRLILEDLSIRAGKATEARIKTLFARQAADGMLRSGSTIRNAIDAVDEIASDFITNGVDKVATVAKDPEAFAMIEAAVDTLLRFMGQKVDEAVRMATSGGSGGSPSIVKASNELFAQSKEALQRQLDIHRFSFTVPPTDKAASTDNQPSIKRNRGGKPMAAHWDGLWAAIAVKLYIGDLQPKTQADIENAMKDWLADKNIDASDSAVRLRARTLWIELDRAE